MNTDLVVLHYHKLLFMVVVIVAVRTKAPAPPKRTSSFRDQQLAPQHYPLSMSSSLPPPPDVIRKTNERYMDESLTSLPSSDVTRPSASSSEELLSTPSSHRRNALEQSKSMSSSDELMTSATSAGTCSRSASLEKILENRILTAQPPTPPERPSGYARGQYAHRGQADQSTASRSNSEDRIVSSPARTAEVVVDDVTSLPPPPTSMLQSGDNDVTSSHLPPPHSSGTPVVPPSHAAVLNEIKAELTRRTPTLTPKHTPSPSSQVPPGLPTDLPLHHLRSSLRKTRAFHTDNSIAQTRSSDLESGHVHLSSDQEAAEQVLLRYGTIPKGKRIGPYLARLDAEKEALRAASASPQALKRVPEVPKRRPKAETLFQRDANASVAKAKPQVPKQKPKSKVKATDSAAAMLPQNPTPEVKQKVERWRADAAQSMQEDYERTARLHDANVLTFPPRLVSKSNDQNNARDVIPKSASLPKDGGQCDDNNVRPSQIVRLTSVTSTISCVTTASDVSSEAIASSVKSSPKPNLKLSSSAKPVPSPRFHNKPRRSDVTPASMVTSGVIRSTSNGSLDAMTSLMHSGTGESLQDVLNRKLSASLQRKPDMSSGTSQLDESASACSGPTSVASAPPPRNAPSSFGSNKIPAKPSMGWLSRAHKMRSSPALVAKPDENSNGRVLNHSASALAANPAQSASALQQQQQSDPNLNSQRANFVVASSGKEILMPPTARHSPKTVAIQPKNTVPAAKENCDAKEDDVIDKEVVLDLSRRLGVTLCDLGDVSRNNRCASNLLHVVDQVNQFYNTCCRYVEALPPHGKFQFREQLASLQRVCDVFKSSSAASNVAEYEKMLSKLQKSVSDIDSTLKNINIQKVRDKV